MESLPGWKSRSVKKDLEVIEHSSTGAFHFLMDSCLLAEWIPGDRPAARGCE
jgi:hypothetical protein